MNDTGKQSYFWYIPILLILTIGYVIGGCLVFCIHFLNWFPSLTDTTARLILKLFGMGMLGSTMYCTKYWAVDIDESIAKPKFLPHAYDSFGYAATIIGGGVTGTVLYMATKSGVILAITDLSNTEIRLSFALFIAFLGGLFHFKVKDLFEEAFKIIFKKNREEATK